MNSQLVRVALIALVAGCSGSRKEPAVAIPNPHPEWQSAFVDVDGLRLHYWRTGGTDRPVIIMAHGITDYGLNWAALAERLQPDYDVVMYDARGHGYSDQPEGPYDLVTHVNDLVGLIRSLDIEQPILMGHSMGGSTVALAAATHPNLARAIILEDPADMLARTEPLLPKVIPDWKKQIRADRKMGKEALIAHARTVRHPGWRDVDYDLWAESKRLVNPDVVEILHGQGFGDAGVTYPRVRVPTLILKADADSAARAKHLAIARLLPNGKLVHFAGAGHVIRNDRPDDVAREIRAFLARCDSTSGRAGK
jgi:pimeloyl-ACP methyl ester carboxylesterase